MVSNRLGDNLELSCGFGALMHLVDLLFEIYVQSGSFVELEELAQTHVVLDVDHSLQDLNYLVLCIHDNQVLFILFVSIFYPALRIQILQL